MAKRKCPKCGSTKIVSKVIHKKLPPIMRCKKCPYVNDYRLNATINKWE